MFKRLFRKIQIAQQKRTDYQVLTMLSDKELHDIGISRGEIRQKIYG